MKKYHSIYGLVAISALVLMCKSCYLPKNNPNEDALLDAIIARDSEQVSHLIESQLTRRDTADVITEMVQVISVITLDTSIYEVILPFLDVDLIDSRKTSLFIHAFWALSAKYDLYPSADGRISQEDKNVLKYLVSRGVNPNLTGEDGVKTIERELSDYELVKVLFESGFSAETQLRNDSTILDFAVESLFHSQTVKIGNSQIPINDSIEEIIEELDIINYIFMKSNKILHYKSVDAYLLNIPKVKHNDNIVALLRKWVRS